MLFPFIDTAPTAIYTLSLHDALPICSFRVVPWNGKGFVADVPRPASDPDAHAARLGRAHRAGDGRARRDRVLLDAPPRAIARGRRRSHPRDAAAAPPTPGGRPPDPRAALHRVSLPDQPRVVPLCPDRAAPLVRRDGAPV